MTKEEAISVLEDYDINFERHTAEAIAEAHEMAIKALEEQQGERTKERTETHECDCISRKATLTAFSDYVGGGMSMNDFDAMWDIVVKMPPVEPKPKPNEDCISRKAVLDALHRRFADGFNSDKWWNSTHVLSAINEVPSATPQPKTGHWIWCASSHKCSNCGEYVCFSHKKLLKYCPECGAKMQEVKK